MSQSPKLHIKVTENFCDVDKHSKQSKPLQFLCTYASCFKDCDILCELCLMDKHSDHKECWVDVSDFLKRVSNKSKLLKERITGSDIQNIDQSLRDQERDFKAVFGLCPLYNNTMYFSKILERALVSKEVDQTRKLIHELQTYISWDQKEKQTVLNPKKFDLSLEKAIPGSLMKFCQKMRKTMRECAEELDQILKNVGLEQSTSSEEDESSKQAEENGKKRKRPSQGSEDEPKQRKLIKSHRQSYKKQINSQSEFSPSEYEIQSDEIDDWGLQKASSQLKMKIFKRRSKSSDSSDEGNENKHGFKWATGWVEELPDGWQDMLEHKSKTPQIGLIISMSEKSRPIKNEQIIKVIEEKLSVYLDTSKSEVQQRDNIIKHCFILKVKTASTIKTAKVLKALIKSYFRGIEICVKTWGSRKMVPDFTEHRKTYKKTKFIDGDSPVYKKKYTTRTTYKRSERSESPPLRSRFNRKNQSKY